MDVSLEIGRKRTFAGAIDWPGWARSGRDEDAALGALLSYGQRYARVLRRTRLGFRAPTDLADLRVVERLQGDATTDFGAPSKATSSDSRPFDEAELRRSRALLRACWRAFDRAALAATGVELRTGPRGGGRKLDAIVAHVSGADAAYLRQLAWKSGTTDDERDERSRVRREVVEALTSASRVGVPERGPRGGKLWTPRYFVRRAAWHVLDHAWEVEDRIERGPRTAPNG